MNLRNRSNEYQQAYPNYEATPKAVIAAIAMSLALQLTEDHFDRASRLILEEHQILYNAGIIPQKPRTEKK